MAGTFAAGKTPEELAAFQKVGWEGARPGGRDPAERLKDMAIDGVEAEVLYTTLGFRLFGLTDSRFQGAIFRAYNDWLAEFCRYDARRFAGLANRYLSAKVRAFVDFLAARFGQEPPWDSWCRAPSEQSASSAPHRRQMTER